MEITGSPELVTYPLVPREPDSGRDRRLIAGG